jgi:ubiquinol-cytochrome c reductase cytochrome c1 subunit
MPHVLGDLQGYQVLEKGEGESIDGHRRPPLTIVQKGTLSPEEYKEFVQDTTNFLVYAAEPGRNRRMAIGGFVLAFIAVLWILSYLLKVEYWKDVH